MCVIAQDDVKFKDVILDGKPAKLNVVTGEVTLVQLSEQNSETKTDSLRVAPILVTNSQNIKPSNAPEISKVKPSKDELLDYYIVKEGDNLFQISLKYNTSIDALKKANNLQTNLIKKGQKLRVRNFYEEPKVSSIWIVKKGDNLYRIAIKNGTTVKAIKRLNGLTSDVIEIGQKLRLN